MSTLRTSVRRVRGVIDIAFNTCGIRQSTESIARQAQAWWAAPPANKRFVYAHWRDGFDDTTWLKIGRESFELYETFARSMNFTRPAHRIVKWGCGGGANAVHFAREAKEFIGVDVNDETLDECGRQMETAGLTNFRPVKLDIPAPEAVLQQIADPCDLFVCLYVFEVFPTEAYGLRILKIAHQLLRSGGMAMIQIKYPVGLSTRSRGWGYRFGVASMTTYPVDAFWNLAQSVGFTPHAVHLVPEQKTIHDERYAYFFLQK